MGELDLMLVLLFRGFFSLVFPVSKVIYNNNLKNDIHQAYTKYSCMTFNFNTEFLKSHQ